MRDFDYGLLRNLDFDGEILNYVATLYECRGKQKFFLMQNVGVLDNFSESAKLKNAESLCEISGICMSRTRLKKLRQQKLSPKNRGEMEVVGYCDALDMLHKSFDFLQITPFYILKLHKMMFERSTKIFSGKLKNSQNPIVATDKKGRKFTIFTPVSPQETSLALGTICDQFNHELEKKEVEPLILISVFIRDFLCIHPFLDGNGRMSRLLTTLLLYKCGYFVGKYVSIDAKIAQTKDEYYNAILKSQIGWNEECADEKPFVKYLLKTIAAAYRDFDYKMEIAFEKDSAVDAVQKIVKSQIGKFTKSEIYEICPSFSESSVEIALRTLCARGEISKCGGGRSTFYTRNL